MSSVGRERELILSRYATNLKGTLEENYSIQFVSGVRKVTFQEVTGQVVLEERLGEGICQWQG
jgi:hypothetical protein